jgi:hypothetical protein
MQKKLFKSLRTPTVNAHFLHVAGYQFHDRISNACFILSFVLIVLNFLLIYLNFSQLPPEVPFFLQRVWGVDQLASKSMLWLQPGLIVIFFLVNYAISLLTSKTEPLIARILGGSVLICSVMSIISIWNIINLIVVVKYWM